MIPDHGIRVFCIGCNYDAHIKELGHTDEDRCVVFMKPASSLVPVGAPIHLPRERGAIHHEVELVVEFGKTGKLIERANALEHVEALTLGLDLTLREIQSRLKQNGHPWEVSKAFDDSAPIGELVPLRPELDPTAIEMSCHVNGELRQTGCTRDMLFAVDQLIEILSRTWQLQPGDLIFTGTPPGVGPVAPGNTITIASPQLGRFEWKAV